ncbi:BCCT family transporter [Marinomonas pollencensis]|uniref:BCCT family betaine/carnitine transporter n=1 Tax=Marinomonas pollencensis TaxID=491954 RepID=A0A3E0DTD3_9GAMM|nr:BCCT family transporter [Marinomonas pollencensis]REG86792.1 BCCT family betaine/carnitine transporter [Marinomonas pollencensis]
MNNTPQAKAEGFITEPNTPVKNSDRKMQFLSILIVVAVVIPLVAFPVEGKNVINALFKWMTHTFDSVFLLVPISAMLFLVYLAFSRYGDIKLSANQEDTAEFSKSSWLMMVFLAGIATGLLLWAGTEWGYHYAWTPFGITPKTPEMYTVAQAYGIFHWGPSAWAIYCVPTIAMSYIYYVRQKHIYNLSESCRGALGKWVDGPLGTFINYLFLFGILGAAATSLGLGTPMIGTAISHVLGIESSLTMNVSIILVCTAVFTISSGLGLDKGIKRLSIFSTVLTLAIVVYILVIGPTNFIIGLGFDSVGYVAEHFIKMSTWTDSVNKSGFPQAWTVFYWAWWIAYAPFMGMFVTRISQGRTIREVVTGMLVFGTAGCTLFYVVVGGYGVDLQMTGKLDVSSVVNTKGSAAAIVAIFEQLPGATILLIALALSGIVLLATTFDSAAYVLACATSYKLGEGEEPERSNRLFWCFIITILPLTLLFVGGLKSMQTASVIVALPLIGVLFCMMITTFKYLKEDSKPN